MKKEKIIAVASIGGHWIQLLRIARSLEQEGFEIVYLSTHPRCATMIEGHKFYQITDFSRWNFYKLFPALFRDLKILLKESPSVVISTGAAPGLICLLVGRLLGKHTIWVDSIANVQHLSFSGKIASKFVSRIYTQWNSNSNRHIHYVGNVLG